MTTAHLELHDVFARMQQNAEALKRLLLAHEDVTLDADRNAAFHELLDEIGARTIRHSERLNDLLVRAHMDRRVHPFERRQQAERRKGTDVDANR
jgi:hypothetical protein